MGTHVPSGSRKPALGPKAIGASSLKPPSERSEVEEATVADADLQKLLAGVSREKSEPSAPFQVPPGWGFHELSLFDYWTRVLDLQRAQLDGPAALSLALDAYQLESFAHLEWLRERFEKRYGKDPDFKQAMHEAREARAAVTGSRPQAPGSRGA